MLYLISATLPWLVLALVVGLVVGWMTHETGKGRRITEEVWFVVAIFVFCVGLAALHLLPGRTGLWLDMGLVIFAGYVLGCFLGHVARLPFDLTVAGRRMRAEDATRAAAGVKNIWRL